MTTFTQPGDLTPAGHTIGQLMLDVVRGAADTPRSRQTTIGLSEYGEPCSRNLGMKRAGRPKRNRGDVWAPTLGTWGHAGITETIRNRPDAADWLLDHPVVLGGPKVTRADGTVEYLDIPGHLDAYHHPSRVVMDWKFCGPSTITKYRRRIKASYRAQIHGYAKALADEGHPVDTVAIVFLPRHHTLDDFWVWTEPFDPAVAQQYLERLALTHRLIDALDLWDGRNVERWAQVPADTSGCYFCDFYNRDATSFADGCPGRL